MIQHACICECGHEEERDSRQLQVLFFVFAEFLEWRKERCRFASSPGARSSEQRNECKKREVVSGARAGLIDS
jgi:hypothetical protein